MWLCAIGFVVCWLLAVFSFPLYSGVFGIMAVMFLCTGLLIESLERLFKKYFQDDNRVNRK